MSDSVTIKQRVQYAIDGNYSNLPLALDYGVGRDFVATASRYKNIRESVPTSGTTFSQSDMTTILAAYIFNEDLTNYVTVTWTSNSASNSQQVPAGRPFLLPQADIASITITAHTAACVCSLVVLGT